MNIRELFFAVFFIFSLSCKGQENKCLRDTSSFFQCDSCPRRFILMEVIPDTISLKADKITVLIENVSPFHIGYGSYYFFQRQTNEGEWKDVALEEENIGWELVLYMLEPKQRKLLECSLLKKFSNYTVGKYRIVKYFELTTTRRIYNPEVAAEFYLK